jgi:FkbM family methyltransferase
MKNGANFTAEGDIAVLVSQIKLLSEVDISVPGNADAIGAVASLLSQTNPALLAAVRSDREAVLAAIKVLGRAGAIPALSNLLANLEIPLDDRVLLTAVIDTGLGGNVADTHSWLVDYDIVGQRIEMIESVVLPYLDVHCRDKILFRAFKEYEAQSLALNTVLVDPQAIHGLIGAARDGAVTRAGGFSPAKAAGATTRLVLPNEVFNILLRLAWTAQDYLFDLHDRFGAEELIGVVKSLDKVLPVYLIPTHLGYPMGGGESFLYQTCRILSEFGVKCIWQSFLDPKSGWYTKSSRTHTPYYLDVRQGGGCSKEAIQQAVDEFHPDLIHAQGGTSDVAMEIAEQSRLTTMIGYHFWHGLVELGSSGNQHILDNIDRHALRKGAPPQSRLIHKYVASEFMQEVYEQLGGKENLQVIHPISDAAQFLARREGLGDYVLQVNVCRLKGGDIFRDCVTALGEDIPFLGVRSEPGDNEYYDALQADVDARPLSRIVSYGNVREFYRGARIVIVPTLVDETFCRVAFEAAMNGIPVLCTANGYLPSMLGETGVFLPETSEQWVDTIRELYHDEERLRRIGESQRARLTAMFGSDFSGFTSSAMGLIDSAATRNIGIFTVWGDLGLGNLSHVHAKLLRSAGYRVHIFSFQPYASIGKGLVRQQDPEDWSVPRNADSVYYSFNHREEVTVYELSQFILTNNIHTLLVPEVCWQPNWERLFAIRISKLKICTIPMIEIVIRDEVQNHNRLTSTLFCTRLSEHALTANGVRNGAFLGFGIGRPLPPARLQAKRDRLAARGKIRFLHIAGHNPRTRKNTPQVMEAFAHALALRSDIELTVTSMDPLASYYPYELPAGITVIDRSLGREEIADLYEDHDVSIQVSSHEGLGLGFYESIARGTPVVSLDAPPHNEIVLEGETGWLIPAFATAMPDNDRAIVSAWRFDTAALTERIVSLGREQVDQVTAASIQVFQTRFDEVALLTRFLQVLPRTDFIAPRTTAPAPDLAQLREEGILTAQTPAGELPFVQAQPMAGAAGARPHGAKIFVKKVLYKVLRRAYRSARPLTGRLAQRFRTLMVEATDDLRRQQAEQDRSVSYLLRSLQNETRALTQAMARLGEAQASLGQVQAGQAQAGLEQAGQIQDLLTVSHGLQDSMRTMLLAQAGQESFATQFLEQVQGSATPRSEAGRAVLAPLTAELELINRNIVFVKDRLATFAGAEAVLTYLRDESPLFVNTGDLGCPSPIVNGGIWEPENLSVLLSFVKDDTVFLDIGANVGYFTVAIGNRLGKRGRVYAFEPHAALTNLIERSIQLNSLEAVAQVSRCAVSDRDGSLELFYPQGHLGRGTASRTIDEPGRTVSVPAHRIDDLLPAALAVDLVKIDVEGHELQVLRGMEDVLRRSPDIKILFEKLEGSGGDSEAVAQLLAGCGLLLYGVGPNAVLVPLDGAAYRGWVGDVLAAPAGAVTQLVRTGFSVYPGHLSGTGESLDGRTRYQGGQDAIVFFGPDWFLQQGSWEVRLHAHIEGPVRITIVEEHRRVLAELDMAPGHTNATFELGHDVVHFELRASLPAGGVIDLERIEFQKR